MRGFVLRFTTANAANDSGKLSDKMNGSVDLPLVLQRVSDRKFCFKLSISQEKSLRHMRRSTRDENKELP